MRETFRKAWLAGVLATMLAGPAAHAAGYADLVAAIRAGETLQVKQLLADGVDASATDGKGAAPLLVAASRGKHDIARLLIARGAALDVRYAAYYDATPLMLALNNRDLDMARLLLEGGAEVNLVDRNGDPAINWSCYYGDIDGVNLLLRHGANPLLVGHGNALEVAMRRGFQPVVERLVDHLGRRHALSPAEQQLQQAIDTGAAGAARAALQAGASPNALDATGRAMLARAARQGHAELVGLLLQAGAAVDAADPIGFTPLFEAAREGHAAAARLLLAAGADVNHAALRNGLAMTPLHAAAASGRTEMVELLAARGARLDALDAEQATPLAWAINSDETTALKLVELGANPDLVPSTGPSPRQLAQERELKSLLAAMTRRRPV